MNIGKKIKNIRLSQGFTTDYVSKKSGIDLKVYEDIENEIIDLTFKQFESIASALEYELIDIIKHDENIQGIRNYFYNHNGSSGTNIHIQGIDQEQIRNAYKELYKEQLDRVPKLEKLLNENKIEFDF